MQQDTLKEILVDMSRDLYDAEKQIVRALPKMIKSATDDQLRNALETHLEETKEQVTRLEQVFKLLGETPKSKPCKGMRGLLEEGREALEEEEGEMLDLAIIAAAQKVEHYEISAYGTARTLAEKIGNGKAAQLLRETEDEEKNADEKLNQTAMEIYESETLEEEDIDVEDEEMATAGARGNGSSRSRSRGRRR